MSEENQEYVEILIGTTLTDLDIAKKDASDLAWDHAVELAKSLNQSLGSTEFEDTFRELADRYEHQTEHLKFFLLTSMLTVRNLIERDILCLPSAGDKITEEEILQHVSRAAHVLVGSYVWLAAGYEFTWPVNDELPEEINVPFYFKAEDIEEEDYIPEEE